VLRLEFIGQQMEIFISFLPRLLLALAVILVGFVLIKRRAIREELARR
jgi:hypothetical protein